MKNDKEEEKPENSASLFQKMLSQTKALGQLAGSMFTYENAVKVGTPIKSVAVATKKILFSSAVSRTTTVATAIAVFAGISPVAPVIAGIGLASVAAGVAIDTYLVAKTRGLHQESKYLARHRLAKESQEQILSKSPKLSKALESKLSYKPNRENKKSTTNRLFQERSDDEKTLWAYAQSTGKVIAGSAVSIFEAVVTRDPLKVLKAVGYVTWGVSSGGEAIKTMGDKRDEFKQHIDLERSKSDSPGYNSRHELKQAAHDQKVQTLALMELTKDNAYLAQPDDFIRQRYDEIKTQIEQKEKMFDLQYRPLAYAKNVVVSALEAHNPFSKYSEINKLSPKLSEKESKIYEVPNIYKIPEKDKKAAKKIINQALDKNNKPIKQPAPIKKTKSNERSV